jgi:hypothetical protein
LAKVDRQHPPIHQGTPNATHEKLGKKISEINYSWKWSGIAPFFR